MHAFSNDSGAHIEHEPKASMVRPCTGAGNLNQGRPAMFPPILVHKTIMRSRFSLQREPACPWPPFFGQTAVTHNNACVTVRAKHLSVNCISSREGVGWGDL